MAHEVPNDPQVKAVGAITYNIKSRLGGLCPEAQFIYDLELPSDFIPKPEDGEVAGFKLCGVDEVGLYCSFGLRKTADRLDETGH